MKPDLKKEIDAGKLLTSDTMKNLVYIGAIFVALIIGIISPVYSLKGDFKLVSQEVEYLKTNHLAHMEDDVAEMNTKITALEKQQQEDRILLERILTILEEDK